MTLASLSISILGGLGEIGMNCMAVETTGSLMVIDCGVLFPREPRMGIDVIRPDFDYLLSRRTKVCGLVLTHGHEDHIAAVPHLLSRMPIPVYGSGTTIKLAQLRLAEYPGVDALCWHVLEDRSPCTIGDFRLTPVALPHSVIENFGLLIESGHRRLFHTGDFKLHQHNGTEARDYLNRIESIAPVDLLLSDSTGADEVSPSGSEASLVAGFAALAANASGLLIVVLFSSNVERLFNVLRVARQLNKKVVLCGKSVNMHYRVATDMLFSEYADTVIPVSALGKFCRTDVIVIASGSQGERRSALGRIAYGDHRMIGIQPGDEVVLSSRIIPGNEVPVRQIIGRLMEAGAVVRHVGNTDNIHVSGHASTGELRQMIRAIGPRAMLPIHGTVAHLRAAAAVGHEAGVAQIVQARNGDRIRLDDTGIGVEKGVIPVSSVCVGDDAQTIEKKTLKERYRMSHRGLITLTLLVDTDFACLRDVSVLVYGVHQALQAHHGQRGVRHAIQSVLPGLRNRVDTPRKRDAVEQAIKRVVRHFLRREYSVHPVICVGWHTLTTDTDALPE